MGMYRQFGAPAASRGSDGDVYDAGQKVFENVAPKFGVPLTSHASAVAARDAFFKVAYPGADKAAAFTGGEPKAISSAAATRLDSIGKTVSAGGDLTGGLHGGPHGMLDMAGHMGDPAFTLFKTIVEMLSQLFSTEAATDLVFGTLPPLELYNSTIEAAYESTKFMFH